MRRLPRMSLPVVAMGAVGAGLALLALAGPQPAGASLALVALALGLLAAAGWRTGAGRTARRTSGAAGRRAGASERLLLAAVLEANADPALLVDAHDTVLMLNSPALRLLETAAEGASLAAAVRDHHIMGLVADARASGSPVHAEVRLTLQRRTVAASAAPLPGEDRNGRVLLNLRDVTPLRQVENARREFVTNVSHELRSPLASVKAMVETLEAGALERPAVARDFLGRINADVDRMSAMVEELLELARVESGALPLERERVDLGVLAADVAASFQARAEGVGVRLTVVTSEPAPIAHADPARLRQVLVNLVDNALKFTPAGGQVSLRAGGEGGMAGMVRVEVADTGSGIAPQHLPHVFERFYKADRSRRDGGTGLGLAIVRHLVAAHGGTVRVESREGEGARFIVLVPSA